MTKHELIEDNMRLVYHILHRYYPTYANDEDLKQCGMIGLCLAANNWDGESTKFSTYAFACITNEIRRELARRSKSVPSISLESQLMGEDGEFELSKIIPIDDVDFDSQIELERFKQALSDEELDILSHLEEDMSVCALARMYGVGRDSVKHKLYKIRRKWREYNGNNKN